MKNSHLKFPHNRKVLIILPLAVIICAGAIVFSAMRNIKTSADKPNKTVGLGSAVNRISNAGENGLAAKIGDYDVTKKEFSEEKLLLSQNKNNSYTGRQIIDMIAKRQIWYEKALESKTNVTGSELSDYISEIKKTFEADASAKKTLDDYVAGLGMTQEQYWKAAEPVYKKQLVVQKFEQTLRKTYLKSKSSSSESTLIAGGGSDSGFDKYLDGLYSKWLSQEKIVYYVK